MFKKLIYAFTAAAIMPFVSCTERETVQYVTMDGFAQGSTYHFVIGTADTAGLQRAVDSLLHAVDMSMSVYEPNSLVNRLNRNETDSVDIHIAYCIAESEKISRLSGGAFDITIRPVTQAWGFAGEGKTDDPNIDSLMQFVGYEKIKVVDGRLIKERPEVQLDLNTVAQGYTADLLAGLIEERGAVNYLMEIGGEVYCRGKSPRGTDWVIGIDRPEEGNFIPGHAVQVLLSLTGKGLATSGNYRKFYTDSQGRKITHIVDARTGYSRISNLLSATVVAENATVADVYGTYLMIIGLDEAIEFLESNNEILGYLVYTDDEGKFRTYSSRGIKEMIVSEHADV